MTDRHGLEDSERTTGGLQASEIDEIEIEELDAEVGFIISSSCTSLELEEEDDLLEDSFDASHSQAEVMLQATEEIRRAVPATES